MLCVGKYFSQPISCRCDYSKLFITVMLTVLMLNYFLISTCLSPDDCWTTWNGIPHELNSLRTFEWFIYRYFKINFKADCFIKYSDPSAEVGHNFKNPSCNVFTYLPSKRNQNRIYLLKFDIQSHRTLESESDNEGKPGMEEKSSARLWFGAAE